MRWKSGFPTDINEKFCLKKDKISIWSDHILYNVRATTSKAVLKWMETCARSQFSPFPFYQNSPVFWRWFPLHKAEKAALPFNWK